MNTSHGKVATRISEGVNFSNNQSFNITSTVYVQNINQSSSVNNTDTVATAGNPSVTYTHNLQFPLTLDISQVTQSNGNINQTTKAWPTYDVQNTTKQSGALRFVGLLTNAGQHQDTLTFDSNFNLLGNSCVLTAANNALATFSPTCSQ